MGKLRSALCLLCLLLLIPALVQAQRILPLDTRPLVEEKYAGWAGVLNLWVYEGWPCGSGSIISWLNHCISGFEKDHPGVYIQPQSVDAGAIGSLNDSGIIPPDMLLFPPNLLTTPDGLKSLDALPSVRTALSHCGEWNEATYAMPVAMGGYLWAWNAERIDRVPDSWRDADALLSVPQPQSWRRWDAALLALSSGGYTRAVSGEATDSTPPPAGEVELGLVGQETPAPTPTPEPRQDATQPRRLPPDFHYEDDAWRHFINGESDAMPVTQREIHRLQSLSGQGKGPRWKLAPGDNAFTDQILSLAIVNRTDSASKQILCEGFLAWLLSDPCQSDLSRVSAFSVTEAASGYGASDPLAIMEAVLRDSQLLIARMCDGQWVSQAEAIVRKFTSDCEDARTLWGQLRESLGKNTNN